jgi:hypothetical protein
VGDVYRKKIRNLHATSHTEETSKEAFKIIRGLIDKVLSMAEPIRRQP